MKKCSGCSRIYDDTEFYCLDDGMPLIKDNGSDSVLTEVVTRRKNRIPAVLIGLILLTGALIGAFYLFSSNKSEIGQGNRQPTVVNVQTSTPTPSLTPVETPTPIPSPSPSPSVSPETNANISNSADATIETPVNNKAIDESNSAKQLPPIMKAEDHSVLFGLQQCRKSGSSITCEFSVINKGQDRRFQLSIYQSKLFDELGNGYKGSDAQIANQTGNMPEIGFINGVTTKARMTFENIEPNSSKITLLELGFAVGNDYNLSVKFRNVPLVISR